MGLVIVAVTNCPGQTQPVMACIHIVGDRAAVSDQLRQAWDEAEALTRNNQGLNLSVAFNYGGRWDIVQACRPSSPQAWIQRRSTELVSRHLALAHAPDPTC